MASPPLSSSRALISQRFSSRSTVACYSDNCLVCSALCFLPERKSSPNRGTDIRCTFYEVFKIPVDPSSLSEGEELPLCPYCTLKLGKLGAISAQLNEIEKQYNSLKSSVAFGIVDNVPNNGEGVVSLENSVEGKWKDCSHEKIKECLDVAEVDTLRKIIFEEWGDRANLIPREDNKNEGVKETNAPIFLKPLPIPKSSPRKSPPRKTTVPPLGMPQLKKFTALPTSKFKPLVATRGRGRPPLNPPKLRAGAETMQSQNKAKTINKPPASSTVVSITTPDPGIKENESVKKRVSFEEEEVDITSFSPEAIKRRKEIESDGEEDRGMVISLSHYDDDFYTEGDSMSVTKMDPDEYNDDIGLGDYLCGFMDEPEAQDEEEDDGKEDKGESSLTEGVDDVVSSVDPSYIENLIAELQKSGGVSGSSSGVTLPADCFQKNEDGLYVCGFCNKTFIHKYPYRDHLKTHTGEGPRCPICEKIFPKNHNLMLHLRTHTGEKPFKCDVCMKGFADKSNLKVHYRVHTGERPYQCEYCSQAFVNSSRLVVHKRLHTGEKPFVCNHCTATFSTSNQLVVHKKNHHHNGQETEESI